MTHKDEGDVVFVCQWIVIFVRVVSFQVTILFQATLNSKVMFASDRSIDGHVRDAADAMRGIDDDVFIQNLFLFFNLLSVMTVMASFYGLNKGKRISLRIHRRIG